MRGGGGREGTVGKGMDGAEEDDCGLWVEQGRGLLVEEKEDVGVRGGRYEGEGMIDVEGGRIMGDEEECTKR